MAEINSNDLLMYIRKILVSCYKHQPIRKKYRLGNNSEFYAYKKYIKDEQINFYCKLTRKLNGSNIGYRIYYKNKLILNSLFNVYNNGCSNIIFSTFSKSEFLYILFEIENKS